MKQQNKHWQLKCLFCTPDNLFWFSGLSIYYHFFQVHSKMKEKIFIQLHYNPTGGIPKSLIINIFTNRYSSNIKFHWYLIFICFGQSAIYSSLVNTAVFGCWLLYVCKVCTHKYTLNISIRYRRTLLFSIKKKD